MKANEDKELSLSPTESSKTGKLKAAPSRSCKDCRVGRGYRPFLDYVELCPLHAAAPELYAACKAALPVVKWYAKLLQDPRNRAEYLQIADQLNAALAKVSTPAQEMGTTTVGEKGSVQHELVSIEEAVKAVYRKYGTNLQAFWQDAFATEAARHEARTSRKAGSR